MQNINKNIMLSSEFVVDGKRIASFQANIPASNPMNMRTDMRQIEPALYWEHRAEVMSEYNEFQDECVKIQQEMLKEK